MEELQKFCPSSLSDNLGIGAKNHVNEISGNRKASMKKRKVKMIQSVYEIYAVSIPLLTL